MEKKIKMFVLVLVVLLFSSCYTSKKAMHQTAKAAVSYPGEFAILVNKLLPIKSVSTRIETKYIQGKDSIVYQKDTVLYCDSANQIFNVLGCKDTYRIDTFESVQVDSFENTKQVESLKAQLATAYVDHSKSLEEKGKLSGQLKESRALNWKLGIALMVAALGIGVLIKLKFF